MYRSNDNKTDLYDRAAIALSGLCLLHCLALPVALLLLPVFDQIVDEHFHLQMLVIVIPISSIALFFGFRRHRRTSILLAGAAGIAILIFGATWAHAEIGTVADRLATLTGSLVLAATHFRNSRIARRHRIAVGAEAKATI